jgi:enamine deaminase RidA (YjgF/YER057c/UK114 family)
MTQYFNGPEIWSPFGLFSHGAILGRGHLVHLKGQIPLDREGELVGRGDMCVQLKQVMVNIQSVLKTVGGTMHDIVSLTQYTTNIDAFMAAGDIRSAFFSKPYPITTTVGVNRLYDPDVLVEITVVAEVPKTRFIAPADSVL